MDDLLIPRIQDTPSRRPALPLKLSKNQIQVMFFNLSTLLILSLCRVTVHAQIKKKKKKCKGCEKKILNFSKLTLMLSIVSQN